MRAHILFLTWVGLYYGIYLWTGHISRLGWSLLVFIFLGLTVQFLVVGVCLLSSVEKRLLGTYVDLNGPWLRWLGLGQWKRAVHLTQYGAMAASLFSSE